MLLVDALRKKTKEIEDERVKIMNAEREKELKKERKAFSAAKTKIKKWLKANKQTFVDGMESAAGNAETYYTYWVEEFYWEFTKYRELHVFFEKEINNLFKDSGISIEFSADYFEENTTEREGHGHWSFSITFNWEDDYDN